MALCASCGLQLSGDVALCPHHHCVYSDDWAVSNRLICNWLHRGEALPRLPERERNEDVWMHSAAMDTAVNTP